MPFQLNGLFSLAPFLMGAVVGWMIFYFIRKYDHFTPTVLMGTLTALIGGDVIAFLVTMKDTFSDPVFHLWYFIGIGISFFLYAIYILIINILYTRGKIKDEKTYGKFTATAGTPLAHLKEIEPCVDEFEYWLLRWYKQKITDDLFIDALSHLSLTRDDYYLCCSYGRFDAAAIAAFKEKGYEQYLRSN